MQSTVDTQKQTGTNLNIVKSVTLGDIWISRPNNNPTMFRWAHSKRWRKKFITIHQVRRIFCERSVWSCVLHAAKKKRVCIRQTRGYDRLTRTIETTYWSCAAGNISLPCICSNLRLLAYFLFIRSWICPSLITHARIIIRLANCGLATRGLVHWVEDNYNYEDGMCNGGERSELTHAAELKRWWISALWFDRAHSSIFRGRRTKLKFYPSRIKRLPGSLFIYSLKKLKKKIGKKSTFVFNEL